MLYRNLVGFEESQGMALFKRRIGCSLGSEKISRNLRGKKTRCHFARSREGPNFVFMDKITYEQIELQKSIIEDITPFLIENTKTVIAFNDENPIEVRIPPHINMKITETDPGEKGNTAQGGTKPATLETGLVIQVPLFVQIGDLIRVDTREKKYVERVK